MKATTLAVTISILASAGLAAVAAYDMATWNRPKEASAGNSPTITGSTRMDGAYSPAGTEK